MAVRTRQYCNFTKTIGYILLWNAILQISFGSIENSTHPSWQLLNEKLCGISNADRIIGGVNANLEEYPWIVRIGYIDVAHSETEISYKCGGSLINEFYVITAAHCVTDLPDGVKVVSVRLGEHNSLTDPDCENDYCAEPVQDFQPASIIFHEKYNARNLKNDIALIRLDKPARYSDSVLPICVINGPLLEKNFAGETGEVAGWGVYDTDTLETSTVLQKVYLPITDLETCQIIYRRFASIGNDQMCVGGTAGKDSCNGDSGGPLMKPESLDGPPRYYLIGIVSFGWNRCGEFGKTGIYTKISYHIQWILDNIKM